MAMMAWNWPASHSVLCMNWLIPAVESMIGPADRPAVSEAFVLYPHNLFRLGSAALDDQRSAGTIMWVGSDILSTAAIRLLVL